MARVRQDQRRNAPGHDQHGALQDSEVNAGIAVDHHQVSAETSTQGTGPRAEPEGLSGRDRGHLEDLIRSEDPLM
jgi:hypothetical protein